MKIAILTGGSRGLGQSAALHLAQSGVGVILTYHSNRKEAEKTVAQITAAGGEAQALQLDVGVSGSFGDFADQVRSLLKTKWNREDFDFLVNNAGTGLVAPFAEITEQQFDELYRVHLKAAFFLTQKLVPMMKDGGRILNTSTGLARFTFPGYSAYAAMKGGIEVLTRYLAKELGPRGITVNTVAPGPVATDFNGGRVRDTPAMNQALAAQAALGRVAAADDIGAVVRMLLSEDSRFITGQRLEVSGGFLL